MLIFKADVDEVRFLSKWGRPRNNTSKYRLYPFSLCPGVYRLKLCLLWKLVPVSSHLEKLWLFKGMWKFVLTDSHLRRGGLS